MVRIELHVQLMENPLQDHLRFSAAAKYNFGLLWWLSRTHLSMQETRVWEDSLEKGMATQTSILAWGIPWTEEPDGLHFHGVTKEEDRTQETKRQQI